MTLLSELGTFRLGGPCARFVDCRSEAEVVEAVLRCRAEGEAHVLIGGGSNLLFSDAGYPGTVIRFWDPEAVPIQQKSTITVPASAVLDRVAEWTAQQGLKGLVCTSGIPGSVGGAVVGNAGAWGQQVGDVLRWARVLTPDGEVITVPRNELGFVYRHSRLKETGEIVLALGFELTPGDRETLLNERDDILKVRAEKHPNLDTHPCIGSIFRNLEPTSAAGRRQAAGFFLEQAGAKDLQVGGARVYEKHANIIVKGESATAQDVADLCRLMIEAVEQKFDFTLMREVRFLGRFEGEEEFAGFF